MAHGRLAARERVQSGARHLMALGLTQQLNLVFSCELGLSAWLIAQLVRDGKLVRPLSGNHRNLQPIDPTSTQLPPVAVLQQTL